MSRLCVFTKSWWLARSFKFSYWMCGLVFKSQSEIPSPFESSKFPSPKNSASQMHPAIMPISKYLNCRSISPFQILPGNTLPSIPASQVGLSYFRATALQKMKAPVLWPFPLFLHVALHTVHLSFICSWVLQLSCLRNVIIYVWTKYTSAVGALMKCDTRKLLPSVHSN